MPKYQETVVWVYGVGDKEKPRMLSLSVALWRTWLLLIAVSVLLVADALFVADVAARPNFVVIFTDDQTFRAIGYNNPAIKTPELDKLARRGVVFQRAYVATPICVSSRASILTSLYPQQHESIALDRGGFETNVVQTGKYQTVAHLLSAAGYVTGFCGKSHLGDPQRYGFTDEKANRDIYDNESFEYANAFLQARATDNRPFFLWVAPCQPHLPLLPDQKWVDWYSDTNFQVDGNWRESPPLESFYNQGVPGEHFYRDSDYTRNHMNLSAGPPRSKAVIRDFMRAYYATISHLDHQIGRLATQLSTSKLEDNTVIVFLSDNGYFLGNHGLGNKITMHEESVRVPMFIVDPHAPASGEQSDSLVSSLDVMPTILEMADLPQPDYLMGKSLVPLLRDPELTVRDYVASECVGVDGKQGQGHRMVCGERFKYILSDTNDEALFDLRADPLEMVNLVSQQEADTILVQLRETMRQWRVQVGDDHPHPPP